MSHAETSRALDGLLCLALVPHHGLRGFRRRMRRQSGHLWALALARPANALEDRLRAQGRLDPPLRAQRE